MAKTYKEIVREMQLAKTYKQEMESIKKQYNFDEKEKFIKECGNLQKENAFVKKFVEKFSELFYDVHIMKEYDNFCNFLYKNGAEPDDIYDYHYNLNYFSNEDYLSIYKEQTTNWGERDVVPVCSIPWNLDMYQMLENMEKYSQELVEKMKAKERLEAERASHKKKESVKEQYELYLKLKEKFEDVENIDDLEDELGDR